VKVVEQDNFEDFDDSGICEEGLLLVIVSGKAMHGP